MKNKLRNIHINDQVWKYTIPPTSGDVTMVRIFYPESKKLFKSVHASKLLNSGTFYDPPFMKIKPSDIKKYILENIETK